MLQRKHLLTLLFFITSLTSWAEETVIYTLTCKRYSYEQNGSSGYESSIKGINADDIIWKGYGINTNSWTDKWRVGGNNSLNKTERYLYSITAIPENISSIKVKHSGVESSKFTVNTYTLKVYSTAIAAQKGGSDYISSIQETIVKDGITTFRRPDGADWTGCYYRFSYKVTYTGSGNAGIDLSYIEFYTDADIHSRTTTTGRFGTLCLPKAVATKCIRNATVYNIAGTQKDGDAVTGIVLEQEEGDLVAGKPYIFKANAEQIRFTMNGDAVTEAIEATGLVGNLGSETIVYKKGYILSNNKLRKINGGTASIQQYRAIIQLDEVEEFMPKSNETRKLVTIGSDTANAIFGIQASTNSEAIYDLQGRRLHKIPAKGQYIKNGNVYVK